MKVCIRKGKLTKKLKVVINWGHSKIDICKKELGSWNIDNISKFSLLSYKATIIERHRE